MSEYPLIDHKGKRLYEMGAIHVIQQRTTLRHVLEKENMKIEWLTTHVPLSETPTRARSTLKIDFTAVSTPSLFRQQVSLSLKNLLCESYRLNSNCHPQAIPDRSDDDCSTEYAQ